MSEARILVLVRQGCHLCDEAVAVIASVCADTGEHYQARDVDLDPALRRRYGNEVPVTFVDGEQHDFWRVDAERLRAALRTRR